jgi:hypothetical protein
MSRIDRTWSWKAFMQPLESGQIAAADVSRVRGRFAYANFIDKK